MRAVLLYLVCILPLLAPYLIHGEKLRGNRAELLKYFKMQLKRGPFHGPLTWAAPDYLNFGSFTGAETHPSIRGINPSWSPLFDTLRDISENNLTVPYIEESNPSPDIFRAQKLIFKYMKNVLGYKAYEVPSATQMSMPPSCNEEEPTLECIQTDHPDAILLGIGNVSRNISH